MQRSSRLQPLVRFLINNLFSILPVFKFYKAKRRWLNWAGIFVGIDTKINGHTIFYGRGPLEIGNETWIGPGCRFYTHENVKLIIGDRCDIAPEVALISGSHEIAGPDRRAGTGTAKDIIIQDGCWIGARVTILGGVCIGKGSIVGAGALVNHDLPANSFAAGVPARVIKILAGEQAGW